MLAISKQVKIQSQSMTPSPVFASSTGIFFEKRYEEPTGYASTPLCKPEYIDSVGQEVAAADAKYLLTTT